jgi:NAD dependent epimerase/dehydratase
VSLSGRRVLVTGAGGFIGSHLAELLVESGAKTRALVHYNALGTWGWLDHSKLASEMDVMTGDITDRDSVRQAVEDMDVVFHLAALIAIPQSYRAPSAYVRTNVEGTLNVLQACRAAGTSRLVHTSTSEVYGTARQVPISEAHPLQGQSPYAASKIGADKMAEAFHLSFGLPVVTVRPFNTFGPRQSARAIVPTIITQGLRGEAVKLGNLTPTRDLTYVTDTAEGFMAAAFAGDAVGKTINLGTGREISVGDLAQTIAGLLGSKVTVERDKTRMRPEGSEVERLLSDNGLAKSLLGWQPRVTLEDGLQKTIAWLREHKERYRPGVYVV